MKNLLPFAKPKINEQYFAIEINKENVKVAIWEIEENKVKIISTSDSLSIQEDTPESLLQSIDMAIASIEVDNSHIRKVILGLEQYWIDEKGIKPEKRKILKYICSSLELTPLGFVAIQDALVTFLNSQDGNPANAILTKFYENKLTFYLVSIGKIISIAEINRTEDITADFKRGFSSLRKSNQFPSRVIMFNSHIDFEDIKQKLLTVSWEQDYPFSQTPNFESLHNDQTIKSIAISSGLEAIKAIKAKKEISTPLTKGDATRSEAGGFEDSQQTKKDDGNEESGLEQQIPHDPNLPEDFVIGREIDQKAPVKKKLFAKLFTKKPKAPKPQEDTLPQFEEQLEEADKKPKSKVKLILYILIPILVLFGLVYGAYHVYYNLPQSDITIYIKPQDQQKQLNLTISQEITEIDTQNMIIPSSFEEISIEGSETIPVTGTKKIGEKASGKVTVFNKTDEIKSFSKDQIIVSSNNLRFILTEDIEIASRSAETTEDGENITFGKADVAIEASGIGEEYNLVKDSEFTFKDISEDKFSAKAVDDINGGISEEIQAVSQEDFDNAEQIIKANLLQEAQTSISTQLGSEVEIIEASQESELSGISFDKDLADEAENLTITATLDLTTLVVAKADFDTITTKVLRENIPDDFEIKQGSLETNVLEIGEDEEDEDLLVASVKVSAKLMPKIDFADIKGKITGKKPEVAENFLKTIPNYVKTNISVSPNFGTLPQKQENISIKIESVD